MAVKVLLLTQWFDPEPTFKGLAFARELVKQGFSVEVVTGVPNYPGGKIYSGYKSKLLQREVIDGVNITRVPLYPSHDCSAVRRVLNYCSFGFSSLIYSLFLAKRPDVIYAYHPPLTTGISALIVRFFRGVPVIYDIQDIWPDTLSATGMLNNKYILNLIGIFCRIIYKAVDKIVVLSPGFKTLLIERGVDPDKIELIYNWCDETQLFNSKNICTKELPFHNKFKIVFAGNIGHAQRLDAIIEAAEKLAMSHKNVCFILIGSGVALDKIKAKAIDKGVKNIHFISRVSMSEVGAYLNMADVLMVHLKDDPLFSVTIPSKTQAYMAIGKPILMAVRGDAADLVEAAGCGVCATPENVDSIVAAVIKLTGMSREELNTMSENARNYYFDKLSLQSGVTAFSRQFLAVSKADTVN